MTSSPPAAPQPEPTPVPTIPPAAAPPAPAAPTNGARMAHVGTAIGAALAILASAYATFQSNQSGQAAIASQHAVTLTQEMLDKARERAAKLEERIDKLEQWRAALEAAEKVRREGTLQRSP